MPELTMTRIGSYQPMPRIGLMVWVVSTTPSAVIVEENGKPRRAATIVAQKTARPKATGAILRSGRQHIGEASSRLGWQGQHQEDHDEHGSHKYGIVAMGLVKAHGCCQQHRDESKCRGRLNNHRVTVLFRSKQGFTDACPCYPLPPCRPFQRKSRVEDELPHVRAKPIGGVHRLIGKLLARGVIKLPPEEWAGWEERTCDKISTSTREEVSPLVKIPSWVGPERATRSEQDSQPPSTQARPR
eukprot:scaffold153286_cov32-Tisochrysis_lutea.AAC.4